MRRRPQSMWSLETLGRERLSRYFYFRDFLYSEIGDMHQITNAPEDPDLALLAGRGLCETCLDPLVETFGPIAVRSGYRTPELNAFGNAQGLNCARNAVSFASHIWDRRDEAGRAGAMASIVVPWFADRYAAGRDWRDLAWWLYDHVAFDQVQFFPKLAAFNIGWKEGAGMQTGRIDSYIAPKGVLHRAATEPKETRSERAKRYLDFPAFRGLELP